ncbi:MAG: iron-sulfur cluster assembly scaffold protein [bacterium]
MAKNDLIGKGLWGQYSKKVTDRMNAPRHFGALTEKDAAQRGLKLVDVVHGAVSCGDAVELFWLVNEEGIIREAKFKTFGCGTAIAASDMMAELCLGKHIDEARRITNLDVERALRDDPGIPAVPGQKMHCSVMAYDVIRKAVAAYKGEDFKDFEDDIVCECARVTRSTIENAIRINNLKTIEEITQYTKAGGYCKSCIQPGGHEERSVYLVNILKEMREKIDKEGENGIRFKELGLSEKLGLVEKVIEEDISPVLVKDGGGLTVSGITGEIITVEYSGHCKGCASAAKGTLDFVEEKLRQKIDPGIKVVIAE